MFSSSFLIDFITSLTFPTLFLFHLIRSFPMVCKVFKILVSLTSQELYHRFLIICLLSSSLYRILWNLNGLESLGISGLVESESPGSKP